MMAMIKTDVGVLVNFFCHEGILFLLSYVSEFRCSRALHRLVMFMMLPASNESPSNACFKSVFKYSML